METAGRSSIRKQTQTKRRPTKDLYKDKKKEKIINYELDRGLYRCCTWRAWCHDSRACCRRFRGFRFRGGYVWVCVWLSKAERLKHVSVVFLLLLLFFFSPPSHPRLKCCRCHGVHGQPALQTMQPEVPGLDAVRGELYIGRAALFWSVALFIFELQTPQPLYNPPRTASRPGTHTRVAEGGVDHSSVHTAGHKVSCLPPCLPSIGFQHDLSPYHSNYRYRRCCSQQNPAEMA